MVDTHLLGVCFFGSLLLLDIPEGTERFDILGIGLWDLSDDSEGIE